MLYFLLKIGRFLLYFLLKTGDFLLYILLNSIFAYNLIY